MTVTQLKSDEPPNSNIEEASATKKRLRSKSSPVLVKGLTPENDDTKTPTEPKLHEAIEVPLQKVKFHKIFY